MIIQKKELQQVTRFRYVYECPFCEYYNEQKAGAELHIKNNHPILQMLPLEPFADYKKFTKEEEQINYKCENCDFYTKYYEVALDHVWNNHTKNLEIGSTAYFYCDPKIVNFIEDEYKEDIKVGDWVYYDNDLGYYSLNKKIQNLNDTLNELETKRTSGV
jgi:hypothetical protein